MNKHDAPTWRAFIKHIGLSGRDGSLSFSKVVTLLVLFTQPPVLLGIACIASAFGAKVFSDFLEHSRFSASASDVVVTEKKEIHEIIERRNNDEGYEVTK